VVKLTGTKSRIVYRQLPQDDPKQRQPDITRAKRLLKWKPRVPLEKGLGLTIQWLRDNK